MVSSFGHVEYICRKVNEGERKKKNIGHISRKINEGDEIEINVHLFEKQLMRQRKTKILKYFSECFFISRN